LKLLAQKREIKKLKSIDREEYAKIKGQRTEEEE